MSDFTYESTYKYYGRIRYVCKCSVCGAKCEYNRKINRPPICIPCAKKRERERVKVKNAEHDKQIRENTIDECKEKLKECWLNGTVANRIVKELQDSLEKLKGEE